MPPVSTTASASGPPRSEVEPAAPSDRTSLGAWDRASFSAAHFAVTAMYSIVSLRGLYRFGRLFGTLEWLINYRRRRRFRRALKDLFAAPRPAKVLRAISRRHFMQTRCDKLIYLIFDRLPREAALSLLTVEGQALLDRAFARGGGVYMALSHHGAHHVIAMLMAMKGYRVAGVRDRKESAIRRFVQNRFDQLYPEFPRMRVIFADAYPRDIYRCLKDGYLLGSAMDAGRRRHAHQKTESVTIFGEERTFLSGPLRVALRCRAPVLQAFILPEPGFRYRFEIVDQLVDPDSAVDEEATIRDAMARYAANVERYIREHPELLTRT